MTLRRYKTSADLEELALVIKSEMRRHDHPADSCIGAARIVVDVLTAFGMKPRPLCVRATVFNPAFMARANASLGTPESEKSAPPRTQEEFDRWYRECGAYALNVGTGAPQPGKWAGHLISVVGSFFLDLTLDQANRPQHNIELPSVIVGTAANKFVRGRSNLPINVGNGCSVIYYAFPGNTSYQSSPYWQAKNRTANVVEAVIKRLH